MRVLVLFERSGIVREAFRRKGHEAFSCDIEPCEDGSRFHIQEDFHRIKTHRPFWMDWDLMIAHPDCTHLSVSGAHRFKEKRADGRQQKGIATFMDVAHAPVKRKCIENPISIMSTLWRKPDQIIQPYEFSDDASKKTCLWLEGLPKLVIDPAKYVEPRWVCECGSVQRYKVTCPRCRTFKWKPRWANQTDSGQNRLGPSEHRAMDRARTYPGIAEAFTQWAV